MKKIINTIAIAALVFHVSVNTMYGKSKNMTTDEFNLRFHKMDNGLTGTWEKNSTAITQHITEYCQFSANGTFIAYEQKDGKYSIIGKGKWMVEDGNIIIFHGEERSAPVKYTEEDGHLVFGDQVTYTRPATMYANK